MSQDKYPRSNRNGSPNMSAQGRVIGDAKTYKKDLAAQFDVLGNWIPTRISGATPFAPKAEMYDELSSTVSAIERGQASKWDFSNLISGMNSPSLDVMDASIELLEVCRVELMKLDEINDDKTLSAQEKKEKIAKEKAFIFGLLEDIRNANARERTFQWTQDFMSSMGKKFGQSLNKTNFALAILGVVACVTISAVGVAALGFLGVCAPYALPFVIAGVCLFAFCKLVKGVYNAWQDANQLATKSKTASGSKVLDKAAEYKEKTLSTPQNEMQSAEAKMLGFRESIAQKTEEKDQMILALQTPIEQELQNLAVEAQKLGALKDQKTVIANQRSSRGKQTDQSRQAQADLLTIEQKIQANTLKQTELNSELVNITNLPQVIALIEEIETIKTQKLAPAAQLYTEKKSAYDTAEISAEQSRARANKTPDATTAARKSLGEILGDEKETGSSKKMGI